MTDSTALVCPRCGEPLDPDHSSCARCGLDVRSLLSTQGGAPGHSETPALRGSLGDFDILRELGRGGMGVVYEAYQRSMHRKVALKILDAGVAPSSDGVARFEREAWIGGRLSHPNIVKVYGQGAIGTTHYIAMELIEGVSLHDVIREAGAARAANTGHVRRMVERFVDVAGALAHVHEQGIVHRDIKPGNLLLSQDGSRLLLTDFGLARDEEASRMTRRGDFLGTVRYMSPEQLLANRVKVDGRSDIYSLGVSLYEATALRLPFDAGSEEAYIAAVTTREPLPARHWSKAIPRDLETVLLKCLQRSPEERYATAADLRSDLLRYLQGHPVQARRPGIALRAGRAVARRPGAVVGALLAFLLGSLGVWSGLQWMKSRDDRATLRRVLEETAARGADPATLTPEWARLAPLVVHAVETDPDGELAQLFHRAACRVKAELSATFGLVRQPPQVNLDYASTFDWGVDWICFQEVDIAWDEGPWTPVMWFGLDLSPNRRFSSIGFNFKFDEILDSVAMTPGPHAFELRVRRAMRRGPLPEAYRGEHVLPFTLKQSLEDLWRREGWSEGRTPFVSNVGRHVLNLFERYPDNFPRKVAADERSGGLDRWFSLDRLVAQHLEVGRRPAHAALASPPGYEGPFCPKEDPSEGGYLEDLNFVGRLQPKTPLPLRAEGTLKIGNSSEPLASFKFCWGSQGDDPIPARDCQCSFDGSPGEATACLIQLWQPWRQPLSNGDYDGTLELIPSRTIARESGNTDAYYGEPLRLKLPVRIISSAASWSTEEHCNDANQPRAR